MSGSRKLIVGAIAGMGAVLLGLLFIGGFFEKFGPPIQIVIPDGFSGVACGRLVAGETNTLATYTLDSRGYYEASDEIRSHRPREVLIRDKASGALKPAPSDLWHPILTENDSRNGRAFAVVWVGPISEWAQHAKSESSFCLDRFN